MKDKLDGASTESEKAGDIRRALRSAPWTPELIGTMENTHLLVCLDSALGSSILNLRC